MHYAVVRRTAIRATLATLLLAACVACSPSSAEKAGPAATVATEPAPTTTTDPYAIPAVIDAAYVNRVLAGLDAAVGDIVRLIIRTKTIPVEAYNRLRSLYADPDFLQIKIDGYQRDIREEFRSYKANPGNRTSTVSKVITARPTCVFVQISRDYTAVGLAPLPELQVQWVGLRLSHPPADPTYNPTPWSYVYDGFPSDHSQPPDPCSVG
jgi:hypothetical protein